MIQKRAKAPDLVIAIGEVKATREPVDETELTRLEHLRTLLPADRVAAPPRLLPGIRFVPRVVTESSDVYRMEATARLSSHARARTSLDM